MVGCYIAADPVEAERFEEYKVIDIQKYGNRASIIYGSNWKHNNDPEFQDLYEKAKKKFRYEPCQTCGRSTQDSFTKHRLPAMARKVTLLDPQSIRLKDGKQPVTMEDFYLLCASLPNALIHASMWSFNLRLRLEGDGVAWDTDQRPEVELSLSCAHSNIIVALDAQNIYFHLNLNQEIDECKRDWRALWKRE